MDSSSYIEEQELGEFYVKEYGNRTEKVPVIDIFIEHQINGKTPRQIAAMKDSLSAINEKDVHRAAYYWTSIDGVYERLEREAEVIDSFNQEFEQNSSETFPEGDWTETVESVFTDIIDESDGEFDYELGYRHLEGGEVMELEFGDSKVVVGTDSESHLDVSYVTDVENGHTLRIDRTEDELDDEIKKRVREMYRNAVFGSL